MKEVKREIVDMLVLCRKLNKESLVRLEECLECEFNRKLCETAPSQNGRPPVIDVLCGLPTRIRVSFLTGTVK